MQVLDVIPDRLVDAAMSSGVANPTPPPPVKQQDPQPTPPVPDPPKKVEPVKQVEPIRVPEKIQPEELKPVVNPDVKIPKPKPQKTPPKVDLTLVTRDNNKAADEAKAAQKAADDKARRDAQKRADAIKMAIRNISTKASAATEVEMKGSSSVSYANYAAAVKKAYDDAWSPPDDMSSDDVTTKVSVTISRDGHVISSRIINPSGESHVDASVQRALDRVDYIAPFPDGATETQRTFIINFNPQAKRLNG